MIISGVFLKKHLTSHLVRTYLQKIFFPVYLVLSFNNTHCNFDSTPSRNTKFIWNIGLAKMCDIPIKRFPYEVFNENDYVINENSSIIWVRSTHSVLLDFCKKTLPKIRNKFILVTNDSDTSVPYDYRNNPELIDLLNDPRLIHWFTQNYFPINNSDKISPIPIGIDFHTLAVKDFWYEEKKTIEKQEIILNSILKRLKPTNKRKCRLLIDWSHTDSMAIGPLSHSFNETRTSIFNHLKSLPFIDSTPKFIRRTRLWNIKGRYAFSVSPMGGGMDCHRTWEDLVLGLIVIVKTSPLDPLFEGLPVVIVKDWDEITQENLNKWLVKYQDAFDNPKYREKLTNKYWFNKIRSKLKDNI